MGILPAAKSSYAKTLRWANGIATCRKQQNNGP